MQNFRVENLARLLAELQAEGATVIGDMQVFDYGNFD